VVAIPVAGGAARQVFSFDVPKGLSLQGAERAASAQRAALTITLVNSFGDTPAVLVFAGPVNGGWSELAPYTPPHATAPDVVERIQVDGERLFTTETRHGFEDLHVIVRDPAAHEVAFASGDEARSATFAGDFVAYRTAAPGEVLEGRRLGDTLAARNWRTGERISSAELPEDIDSIAVSRDGRAATTTMYARKLYELRPGRRRG
jgi:hypothetical protein